MIGDGFKSMGTMKTMFKTILAFAAAAIAFVSCVKEEQAPVSETKTVQFVAKSIETKTAFGEPDDTTYPTLWTANDAAVKLLLNLNEEFTADVTVADDFKTASFNIDVTLKDSEAPYTFYAMSPASAYLGKTAERYSATIPTSQTPLVNSVDEDAQILYAVSNEFKELPNTVDLLFKHFTAYGNLTFGNLEIGDATVTSIAISSADVNLAGRWNYVVANGTFTENSGEKEITLDTDKTENLWFACAPVGSMDGKKLKFTVNTDKGSLSKEVTLSGDKYNFEAGHIAKMKVDMDGITFAESKVYELVTDAADLTVDSKIIIVAKDDNYALSTAQNNNNRGQAPVTKGENIIENPGDGVQIITLEEGTTSGTLAFNVGNGYLYAASSSSNHLKTQTTNNSNGSWIVTISEGIATIKAQGTNTRNLLKYNSTNNPPIFSCYGSGQSDVSIYKLQGSGTVKENYLEVSTNAIAVTADASAASFTVNSDLEWTASSDNATVSTEGNTVNVSFAANEDTEEKTYTVTVSADGVESQVVTITQAGKVDTNFEAGQYWIMATEDGKTKVLTPLADNLSYGYGASADVTENRSYAKNAFTFTEVAGGFTIQDASGKYYYADGTHKSFQLTTDSSTEGIVWSVTVQNDGTYVLTNVATERTMKYGDGTYTTFGVYLESDSDTGVYPTLVKADNPLSVELSSISVSGHKTSFTEGDSFEFGGTVTATYTDDSTKDVTANVSVTEPNMEDGATVTVSYTEGTITKTFEYTISVKAAGEETTTEQELSWTLGTKAYSEKATINGTSDISVLKLGTSSAVGSATVTLPAGTVKVKFSAVGWNGKTSKLEFKNGSTTIYSITLTANTGAANNTPYTMTTTDTDNYEFDYSVDTDTQITLSTVSGSTRAIIWNIVAVVEN